MSEEKGHLVPGPEKVLKKDDLVKRLENLLKTKQVVEEDLSKIQNVLTQKSNQYQQVQGALQDTGELLTQIVGVEEAQKIVDELQKPKKKQEQEK